MLTKLLGASWKTSLYGIVTILCGAALTAASFYVPVIAAITVPAGIGMMTAGGGLLMAKDRGVTGIGEKATSDTNKDATKE